MESENILRRRKEDCEGRGALIFLFEPSTVTKPGRYCQAQPELKLKQSLGYVALFPFPPFVHLSHQPAKMYILD